MCPLAESLKLHSTSRHVTDCMHTRMRVQVLMYHCGHVYTGKEEGKSVRVCMYVCMHVCMFTVVFLYTTVVNFPLYEVRATVYGFTSLLIYMCKVSDGTALSNTVYIEVKSTRYIDRRLFQLSLW